MTIIVKWLALFVLLDLVFSYNLHNALNAIIFTNLHFPPETIHSEYYFGKCASRTKRLLIKHVYTYKDLKDFLVLRGHLMVDKEPSCVYLRGKSMYSEIIRYHAFKFNICICRLLYNYGGLVFEHYFYEWYIPVEMMKGIVWEIYFYE